LRGRLEREKLRTQRRRIEARECLVLKSSSCLEHSVDRIWEEGEPIGRKRRVAKVERRK
jgi:hypothetical protein